MTFFLEDNGFAHPDSLAVSDEAPPAWALRVASPSQSSLAPQWLALRTGPPHLGALPGYCYFGALELPEAWVAKARADGQVLACWPTTLAGDDPELDENVDSDTLDELLEDDALLGRRIPLADEHEPSHPSNPPDRAEHADHDRAEQEGDAR